MNQTLVWRSYWQCSEMATEPNHLKCSCVHCAGQKYMTFHMVVNLFQRVWTCIWTDRSDTSPICNSSWCTCSVLEGRRIYKRLALENLLYQAWNMASNCNDDAGAPKKWWLYSIQSQCPTGRFFNIGSIGSWRVLKEIPDVGSGSGTRWALFKALLKLIIIHVQFWSTLTYNMYL